MTQEIKNTEKRGYCMKSRASHRGFTLIETFVASAILLVSLAGPLSIAAQALRTSYYARDQVTAFYLAQEGLEYVRAKRDQNYLASPAQPWMTGLMTGEQICTAPAVCNVDFPNFTHLVCVGGVCAPLRINQDTFLFNTALGNPSLYTRKLTLTQVSADEVNAKVTISWVSAGINRAFTISENFFNWL
ncbi:hypothetical protein K2X83_03130 [Patescibacteria group bacterium]|nr:hypothetical protein [Patescibacteria group bacterium]